MAQCWRLILQGPPALPSPLTGEDTLVPGVSDGVGCGGCGRVTTRALAGLPDPFALGIFSLPLMEVPVCGCQSLSTGRFSGCPLTLRVRQGDLILEIVLGIHSSLLLCPWAVPACPHGCRYISINIPHPGRLSLSSPGLPAICFVDQSGFDGPASASQPLGLQVCTTVPVFWGPHTNVVSVSAKPHCSRSWDPEGLERSAPSPGTQSQSL